MFTIYNRQKELLLSKRSAKRVLRQLFSFLHIKADEVILYFVSEKQICALHEQFFNDPTPTDCITFPSAKENSSSHYLLGEIVVCPKTALHYVQSEGGDPYEEATLYVTHALLHLLGYDDISAKDRKVMRKMEALCMKELLTKKILLSPT